MQKDNHIGTELEIKEKQIDALYNISEGFYDISNKNIFLHFLAKILPTAFLSQDDTSVLLKYENKEYKSDNFFPSDYNISSTASNEKEVKITVFFRNQESLTKNNKESLAGKFINLISKRASSKLRMIDTLNDLQKSNKLLSTLLETIPNPVFYKNSKGELINCNRAFEVLFNIKIEDVLNKTVFDILPFQIAEKIHIQDEETIKTQKQSMIEVRIPQGDSMPKDVIVYKVPITITDEKNSGILGIIIDITEIRKNERLRKIQHGFEQVIAVENGMRETINTIMKSVLQLDCADSIGIYFATNDKELVLHFHMGLSKQFANHIKLIGNKSPYAKQIFNKKSVFGNYEKDYSLSMDDIRRKEGIKSLAVVPMVYREEVIGCINIASKKYNSMSQSDRNAIELLAPRIANMMIFLKSQEELKANRQMLEEKVKLQSQEIEESTNKIKKINKNLEKKITKAVEEKARQQSIIMQKSKLESLGELAAGIAHEINQPLGIMALALENIQVKYNSGISTKKYINEKIDFVFENIFRIRKIIDHIRTFSRDSDISTIGELSINSAVNKCLSLIGTQYKNHNIEIQLLLDDRLYSAVGDVNSFEQVVLNLLANAKHSLDEKEAELMEANYKKRIIIKSFNKNNTVVLSIEDNGMGIQKNNIDKIFDPFFTTKPEGVGTGLGLSIVFGIIKNMKGDIYVESEVNEFARFTVELPKLDTIDIQQLATL